MSKKAVFRQIIADSIARDLGTIYPRDQKIPVDTHKVVSLTGPRRAGKTFMLYYLIQQLRTTLPRDRLLYMNFEDDRLFPLQIGEMDDFLSAYYELYPHNKQHTVYFFLDEVQEVKHWEKFVRRLDDQENCRIYITGSSSRLLSRELASSLRGRTLPYEVFPLSFSEYLKFRKIEIRIHTSEGIALAKHHLRKYLRQGGFPELIFLPEHLHQRVITEYLDLMLYRDLSERFGIKNPSLMKYLLKYLFQNLANLLSVNKVYHDLKSRGYKIAKDTVYDYISYLEEAFAVFRVEKWSKSIRKQAVNPSKIYSIDSAYKYAMNIGKDEGRIFENAVFMQLRRRGQMPNYFKEKQEVDFCMDEGQILVNACWDLTIPETKHREISGLREAMKFFGQKQAVLLCWDETEDIKVREGTINVRPLWKFLLNKSDESF